MKRPSFAEMTGRRIGPTHHAGRKSAKTLPMTTRPISLTICIMKFASLPLTTRSADMATITRPTVTASKENGPSPVGISWTISYFPFVAQFAIIRETNYTFNITSFDSENASIPIRIITTPRKLRCIRLLYDTDFVTYVNASTISVTPHDIKHIFYQFICYHNPLQFFLYSLGVI